MSTFSDLMKVIKMDVRNDEEVNYVYEDIKKDLELSGDQLWAIVNNAGILDWGHTEWGTLDTYKNVFEVNTFGLVRVTRTFLPLIRSSKGINALFIISLLRSIIIFKIFIKRKNS